MEERQEPKHVCKFCNKSFPNGRSLGGHMRSHISNLSAETEKKLSTRKLNSSLNNGGSNTKEAETSTGYDLRENPKKTSKFADLSEDTLLLSDKFCKECGKGFPSWKALFGHMKCHSKERASIVSSEYDQDSWTNNNSTQKLVMDSQSDNEATALNRRRRSKRTTRYISAAANSSVSFANPSSSSVSEVEQEQEEVAMSLMMLSRDVGNWGGLNFVAECSDNSSAYLSSVRTNLVSRIQNGSLIAKLKKLSDVKLEVVNSDSANNGKESELFPTECSKNVSKMNKGKVSLNGHLKDDKGKKTEQDYQSAMEDSDGTELNLSKSASIKFTSIKRKFTDSESKPKPLKNLSNKPEEAELSKDLHKRGRFECTTCNKIFHSYQALGGHRASHKKIKAEASSENSIETDPTTESKLMKKNNTENENGAGFDQEAENVIKSKKSKNHECPICFKVFPSGQALGGHKRSHFAESKNCQTVVHQEPGIRDLLDLNLPAATEEQSNSQTECYKTWWVGSSHKQQEALVGLISN